MKKLIAIISLLRFTGCAIPLSANMEPVKPTAQKMCPKKTKPEFKVPNKHRWWMIGTGAVMLGGSVALIVLPSEEAEYSVGVMLPFGAMMIMLGIMAE